MKRTDFQHIAVFLPPPVISNGCCRDMTTIILHSTRKTNIVTKKLKFNYYLLSYWLHVKISITSKTTKHNKTG